MQSLLDSTELALYPIVRYVFVCSPQGFDFFDRKSNLKDQRCDGIPKFVGHGGNELIAGRNRVAQLCKSGSEQIVNAYLRCGDRGLNTLHCVMRRADLQSSRHNRTGIRRCEQWYAREDRGTARRSWFNLDGPPESSYTFAHLRKPRCVLALGCGGNATVLHDKEGIRVAALQ